MDSKTTIEIVQLSFGYERENFIENMNLKMEPGIYGLLGPNGAGKTTLINLLVQNLSPKQGHIFWCGKEIKTMDAEYRKLIGYKPQQQSIYPEFTIEDFMYYVACLKGICQTQQKTQIDNILFRLHLTEHKRKKLRTLSGGMLQRTLLSQALLGDPLFIILDEPTAGLDPMERINMRKLISEISKEKIVLFATHIIEDIANIATEIIFLNHGKILLKGTMNELKSYYEKEKENGKMNHVVMQDEILVLENLYSELFHH